MHLTTLADHITVSGDVSGEWDADTVRVIGDLTVPDGENLLIRPGTVVEFQGSFAMNVEGSISAIGVENDIISFQALDTTGFFIDTIPDGGWRGIRFDHNRTSNEFSVFDFCRFSYGKSVSGDPLTGNGGAICIKAYDKVSISNCQFTDNFATYNGGAVSLDSADVAIHNCIFTRNRCGLAVSPWGYGGAISSDNSSPDIRWNTFTDNSSTGIGGAVSVRYKDCNIYNNVFTGNFSALGGALGVLHIPECYYRINTNLFAENAAQFFGGGIASINASPIYINNTVAYNTATYGGGFYCKDSISPDFYNTIIWGNTAAVGPQGYLFEVYAQADFFFCDIEGGPALFGGSGGGEAFFGAYENCLDLDPEFAGSGEYPYELSWDSPCYDAGSIDTNGFMLPETDLAGNPRHSHGFIDIGAYEIVWIGLAEKTDPDEMVKVWPNPTSGKFKVQSASWRTKFKDEVQRIELVDIFGKCVFELETKSIPDPVEIDISHLTVGIYLVKISVGDICITNKLVKVSHR